MDSATISWIVLLGSCIALTAVGTLIWKRPVTAALCVAGLVNFVTVSAFGGGASTSVFVTTGGLNLNLSTGQGSGATANITLGRRGTWTWWGPDDEDDEP